MFGRVGRVGSRGWSAADDGTWDSIFLFQASVVNFDFECVFLSVYGELKKVFLFQSACTDMSKA